MTKGQLEILEAMQALAEATADVAMIAQALVATEGAGGVRGDIFEDLKDACALQREAGEVLREVQDALVVDTVGEALEGAGAGGMVS
jgi:hypothetical protein